MLLRIREYPEPVLREQTKRIYKISSAIEELAASMMTIMKKHNGVGLAAPQVGQAIKLAVVNTVGHIPDKEEFADDTGFNGALINPSIESSEGTIAIQEGCLSFPGLEVAVPRAAKIVVAYTDIYGRDTVSTFTGFTAIVVQHELDHLNHKLFIDYD